MSRKSLTARLKDLESRVLPQKPAELLLDFTALTPAERLRFDELQGEMSTRLLAFTSETNVTIKSIAHRHYLRTVIEWGKLFHRVGVRAVGVLALWLGAVVVAAAGVAGQGSGRVGGGSPPGPGVTETSRPSVLPFTKFHIGNSTGQNEKTAAIFATAHEVLVGTTNFSDGSGRIGI